MLNRSIIDDEQPVTFGYQYYILRKIARRQMHGGFAIGGASGTAQGWVGGSEGCDDKHTHYYSRKTRQDRLQPALLAGHASPVVLDGCPNPGYDHDQSKSQDQQIDGEIDEAIPRMREGIQKSGV